jgi:hypothetical protein
MVYTETELKSLFEHAEKRVRFVHIFLADGAEGEVAAFIMPITCDNEAPIAIPLSMEMLDVAVKQLQELRPSVTYSNEAIEVGANEHGPN